MGNKTREQIYSDYANGTITLSEVTERMGTLDDDVGHITPSGRILKSILDVGLKILVPFGSYRNNMWT